MKLEKYAQGAFLALCDNMRFHVSAIVIDRPTDSGILKRNIKQMLLLFKERQMAVAKMHCPGRGSNTMGIFLLGNAFKGEGSPFQMQSKQSYRYNQA